MAANNYKVGDKVKVVDRKHGHDFNIGEVCVIDEVIDNHYKVKSSDDFWYLRDDELALYTLASDSLLGTKICITREYTVYRKLTDDKYDICDNDGNCITVTKDEINSQSKIDNMKAMKDAVLKVARDLAKANNTVTTLEIKTELRRDYPYYYWDQSTVSNYMAQLAGDGLFTYTDNGTYRTYSLVQTTQTASVGKTLVVNVNTKSGVTGVTGVSGITGTVGTTGTVKKTKKGNKNITNHGGAVVLVTNGRFNKLTLKNGTVLDAYDIRGQKKTPLSYVKRAKTIDTITVDNTTYTIV